MSQQIINEREEFYKYNIVGEISKLLIAICSNKTVCSNRLLCGKGLDDMEDILRKIRQLQMEILLLEDRKVDKTTKVNQYALKTDVDLDAPDVGVNIVPNKDIDDLFD